MRCGDFLRNAATRKIFYPGAEMAGCCQVTVSAVTHANCGFDAKLRHDPQLADELIDWLKENK